MSSGNYFPQSVKAIEIPKKSGGTRILSIPTVLDRVAQIVAKIYLEPQLEPYFHPDSYGYRSGKSDADALAATRKRCWKYNWLLEFDIKGLFDNINHELLMEQVSMHTDKPWIILYIQRWLKAPFQMPDGIVKDRTKRTPQGGVVSPLLVNLFLHYAFDKWMANHHRYNPFARYSDDAVIHCRSKKDADRLRIELEKRLSEFGLELHPTKTRIVYCEDDDRQEDYPETKFDFLGYSFRPRRSKNKYEKHFVNFTPAVSNMAKKAMQQEIRGWSIHLKSDKRSKIFPICLIPYLEDGSTTMVSFTNLKCTVFSSTLIESCFTGLNVNIRDLQDISENKPLAGKIARMNSNLFIRWQMGIFSWTG
jgi:RNA-directed DNA polymerase